MHAYWYVPNKLASNFDPGNAWNNTTFLRSTLPTFQTTVGWNMPWFGRQDGQKLENQGPQMGFLNAYALPVRMFVKIGQMYGWHKLGLLLNFRRRNCESGGWLSSCFFLAPDTGCLRAIKFNSACLKRIKCLGQIQVCRPNFRIPFNDFSANSLQHSQCVINSGASSNATSTYWLHCVQNRVQTVTGLLAKFCWKPDP